MTEEQLRKVRNLGKRNFEEIVAKMQEFGISFKTKEQLEKEIIEKQEKRQQELSEEREKKFRELFGEDDELQEETEKDETDITSENKDETEKQVAVNDEQKKKEINFEDMAPEQLQRMIDENQRIIENNEKQIKEDIEKSKLIQRLLEQQQTIDAQQEEINRLRKLLETPQQ